MTGTRPGGEQELLALFRSTDDGRSWQRTWRPTADAVPGLLRSLVAGADGSLRLYRDGPDNGVYTSTDGGRTLTRSGSTRLGPVIWTRAGYLAWSQEQVEVSTDGLNWTRSDLP